MKIVRDALIRRKAELERQRVEQTIALRQILDEEVKAVAAHARGEVLVNIQDIISHRTFLEKQLSEKEMLIEALDLELKDYPVDDSETLTAAKEAASLVKFEELRNDILTTCLPKLKRAFVLYHDAGKFSYWSDFLFEIMQFQQPNKDEWHSL